MTDDALRDEVERRLGAIKYVAVRTLDGEPDPQIVDFDDAVSVCVSLIRERRGQYDDLTKAARHFVWKCENGRASSRESYKQFKEALAGCAEPTTDDEPCTTIKCPRGHHTIRYHYRVEDPTTAGALVKRLEQSRISDPPQERNTK